MGLDYAVGEEKYGIACNLDLQEDTGDDAGAN